MVYTPHEWQDSELITKESLNRIEDGIGGLQELAINVDKYGAVGDGVRDDSDAIQLAIDSNPGGIITLSPNKRYNISKTIFFRNKTSFDGNMSTIWLTNTADYAIYIDSTASFYKNFWLKKDVSIVANGIYATGSANYFSSIYSKSVSWETFFHGVSVTESHFNGIRVDNNPTSKTGKIFELDYCVNNTISQSFIGYAEVGIYFSDIASTTNYYNEGFMISDTTIIQCGTAVYLKYATSVNISNSILDFCGLYGVKVNSGQALFISNSWIALVKPSAVGVGAEVYGTSNFREIIITNNEIVGTSGTTGQVGFNLGTLNINAVVSNNVLQTLNGGRVWSKTASVRDNLTPGFSSIEGYQKNSVKTSFGVNTFIGALGGTNNSMVKITATQAGTANVMTVAGSVDSVGLITLKTLSTYGISMGSINQTTGTISVTAADGNSGNLLITVEIYPYDIQKQS